jgi:hypothetical protein
LPAGPWALVHVHRTQLRQRELEVAEQQRVAAAKERAIDGLRETLSAAKRTYEARLTQTASALASRETEVGLAPSFPSSPMRQAACTTCHCTHEQAGVECPAPFTMGGWASSSPMCWSSC